MKMINLLLAMLLFTSVANVSFAATDPMGNGYKDEYRFYSVGQHYIDRETSEGYPELRHQEVGFSFDIGTGTYYVYSFTQKNYIESGVISYVEVYSNERDEVRLFCTDTNNGKKQIFLMLPKSGQLNMLNPEQIVFDISSPYTAFNENRSHKGVDSFGSYKDSWKKFKKAISNSKFLKVYKMGKGDHYRPTSHWK